MPSRTVPSKMVSRTATLSSRKHQFCTAKEFEKIEQRKLKLIEKLNQLKRAGKIGDFEEKAESPGIVVQRDPTRTGIEKWRTSHYDEYSRWAGRNHLTLEPDFREEDGYIFLPQMYLVITEKSTRDVQAVFPCYDKKGKRRYEIEDYLDALEQDRDWVQWPSKQDFPDIDPNPIHSNIKKKIKKNPAQWLGEQWGSPMEEYPVSRSYEEKEQGQIDLVFKHTTEDRYLLVEVKTIIRGVDRAFGQLLRYSRLFLEKRDMPGVSDKELDLVIAAPDFDETHYQIAEALGIRLVRIVG